MPVQESDRAGGSITRDVGFRRGRRADLPLIRACANRWNLDDERLAARQFIVAYDARRRLIGFGRVKPYRSCFELGTVGVMPRWRGRGLGRALVERLIERFPSREIWITTDLHAYFAELGFKLRRRGPKELAAKIQCVCRVKGRRNCRIMHLKKCRDPKK